MTSASRRWSGRARPRAVADSVVLITGAARGIGAGLAERLAAQGGRVAVVGREPELLRAVARRCGPAASWWEADVRSWSQLHTAVAGVLDRYGRLDVVVANAGVGAAGFVRSIDPAAFERVIDVDLLGVWRTARTCLPALLDSRGYFLSVASMAAMVPVPGNAPYNAAKAGAEAFANTLRAEVRHLGVRVGVAYPTWIDTDLVRAADADPIFGPLRRAMPPPARRTYPLAVAVDALAAAVARRARTMHVPPGLRALALLRDVLPPVVERLGTRAVSAADRAAAGDDPGRLSPGGGPAAG